MKWHQGDRSIFIPGMNVQMKRANQRTVITLEAIMEKLSVYMHKSWEIVLMEENSY